MKIFDCFMYFDEDILLDLRLNVLNDYVHKFVILEASEDHQGNKRNLKFDISKYEKFKNKIKYISLEKINIDETIKLKKNWDQGHLRDQSMRNEIKNYLDEADDNDLIIISDLDEIPNPIKFREFDPKNKYAFFEQSFFYYKFNVLNTTQPKWYGSRICIKKYLKSPQWLRNIKIKKKSILKKYLFNQNYQVLIDGGWHFSNLKTPRELIDKISSFCHGEFNKLEFKKEEIIKKKIENLEDIFDRNVKYKKINLDKSFPDYLVKNKSKYLDWIL